MKNLIRAYLTLDLKPDIRARFVKLSEDKFIDQATELLRGDDFFNNLWKVNEEKIELMSLCDDIDNGKTIDTERFAELRFNRMLVFEEILMGGYDSVATSKINSRMDNIWKLIK